MGEDVVCQRGWFEGNNRIASKLMCFWPPSVVARITRLKTVVFLFPICMINLYMDGLR